MIDNKDLKKFLDQKHDQYNIPGFIDSDPIQIPHRFNKKEDIEISAFLTSTIAWGRRNSIIKSASNILNLMGNMPYEFIINKQYKKLNQDTKFVHRTFNMTDLLFFFESLKNIYTRHGGLENVFLKGYERDNTIFSGINYFREIFLSVPHEKRSEKHIADVTKGSAGKRINLFLMWMIRNDNRGVHFGLWNKIPTSELMLPLDIHSGNTARALGLLKKKQNNWKSVEELTKNLRRFDNNDPVKYDFSLFGLGVFEAFNKL